jgi:hypothetical protein
MNVCVRTPSRPVTHAGIWLYRATALPFAARLLPTSSPSITREYQTRRISAPAYAHLSTSFIRA